LDTLIESLKVGTREFDKAMNVGAQMMAKITQGHAESLYRGPQYNVSGARANPSDFTIPVRRVTGKTYRGWRVKMIRFGAWECFTEERGAYMVEFGIVSGGGGKRQTDPEDVWGTAHWTWRSGRALGSESTGATFGELQMNKGKFGNFGRLQGSVYLS
jgi:hypothetical protein